MSWDRVENEASKGPVRAALVLFGLLALLVAVSLGLRAACMPAATAVGVAEKALNADNVIYNYEWFKQQYRDVLAIDKKIEAADRDVVDFAADAGPRQQWTFEDKTEAARLRSILSGLMMQRADMVAKYNARASMVNRQIFMGGDCPQHIN